MRRAEELANGEIYHVMNKSIASYKIFHNDKDYERMVNAMLFFVYGNHLVKFSHFLSRESVKQFGVASQAKAFFEDEKKIVQIISYCLMPTHLHLVLRQLQPNGISLFMGNILNSYTRYFNTKRKRKGPLWVGRFKGVRVTSDQQLLHLTRYIHLNPTSAGLVKAPKDWKFSSYWEFISDKGDDPICEYKEMIDMSYKEYRSFVEDYTGFQRELALIKHLVLE